MNSQDNLIKDLEGKIALVTGGTKGIGKAIAARLTQAGANVIITARNRPQEAHPNHHFIAADLSLSSEVSRVADEINGSFGGVDILVNNMGPTLSLVVGLVRSQMSIGIRLYKSTCFPRYA